MKNSHSRWIKIIWIQVVVFGTLLMGTGSLQAQTRRAVIVGIDTYQPIRSSNAASDSRGGYRRWKNLEGAVNDALTMQAILTARYGFLPANVHLLKNGDATRANLLSGLQKYLVDEAASGDVCLFYYSGHGSQVMNSKSNEPDLMDEALVPADANQGVAFIRDKELAKIYHQALHKGVLLTVIIDSCHSGSSSRGYPIKRTIRAVEPDLKDVADPPQPGPTPEEEGALVLTAAQDTQAAVEVMDERGLVHGAFSWALFSVLRQTSRQEPVEKLFSRLKARLYAGGIQDQEPVLGGKPNQRQAPLFGNGGPGEKNPVTVAVLNVKSTQEIELQGGLALGLSEGCELLKNSSQTPAKTRLQVTKVTGVNRCQAKLVKGSLNGLSAGDLFEVAQWTVPEQELLRVWHPPATLLQEELTQFGKMMEALLTIHEISVVTDPTITSPTHIMVWNGVEWDLIFPDGRKNPLGRTPTVEQIQKTISPAAQQTVRLFINFPPSRECIRRLQLGSGSRYNAVKITDQPELAQYVLLGRWHQGAMEYAWALPNLTESQSQTASLPVITDWISLGPTPEMQRSGVERLEQFALRIGKARAWLTLDNPPDEGLFPYHLALKNAETGEVKHTGTTRQGETYRFLLQATGDIPTGNAVENRYVYVFILDQYGNSTLLFPEPSLGNVENLVPYRKNKAAPPPKEFLLGREADSMVIGPPYGTDTIVLLSTLVPLENPEVLDTEGVRSERNSIETPKARNPLEALLANLGSGTRTGGSAPVIANWSIERITLRSVPKKGSVPKLVQFKK